MDEKTLDYYSQHAPDVFKRYDSVQDGIEKYFKEAFPQKGHILDIGAGSGRDVRYLIQDGHKAYGLEPCDKLRSLAIHKYPELSSFLIKGRLPDDIAAINRKFDGIICSAVLMHIPKEYLFDSIFLIKRILKPNGRALISIPQERGEIRKDHRDDKGRLYTDITAEYLELLFERIGFNLINKWVNPDSMGRKGYSWATLLFRLSSSEIIRPIDQIEGVLNRDRKVATYKLALFRALCEIAMTNFQRVRWMPDGKVGIPIHDVIEKWIYYYWPILESSTFIPQIQGESESCAKPIAFRAMMDGLIKRYHIAGGLPGFTLDLRNDKINTESRPIIKKLFTCLKNTIVKGPLSYAGGSLKTGTLFEYDAQKKLILLDYEIWKELSLMSHWILDALILRWAELTSRLSKNSILPSEVINLLLESPLPERNVIQAKKVYENLQSLECVWSGSHIRKFDVDHLIPFSFWRNNDLWNLLPVRPDVNNKKRDKLPTHNIINKRKDAVIYYWRILKSSNNRRFSFEAEKFTGSDILMSKSWEIPLFSALVEAIEVTALQRGCERWEL